MQHDYEIKHVEGSRVELSITRSGTEDAHCVAVRSKVFGLLLNKRSVDKKPLPCQGRAFARDDSIGQDINSVRRVWSEEQLASPLQKHHCCLI
jgi:hypothetical protein